MFDIKRISPEELIENDSLEASNEGNKSDIYEDEPSAEDDIIIDDM